jgi:plasmid maintenance system antidote protein VapI
MKHLKLYILATGVKKKMVAEQLGITPVYLSYLLNDKAHPSKDLMSRINKLIDAK